MEPHYFTLDEANSLLEILRPLIFQILGIRQVILERQAEVWPLVAKAAGNGGGKPASEMVKEFNRLDHLIRQVQATGVILKDINTGLVDFPSQRSDREIYLCWQYGESQVSFWHDLDAGFSGRQAL